MSTPPTIGLIDYGAGNLLSVHNALRACGVEPKLVRTPADLAGLDKLILPGVGAFGDCVENLNRQELWAPLRQWLDEGRPYFGICLGYQILFSSSEESPGTPGLGVLPGKVVKFPPDAGLKVPHMGWNTVRFSKPSATLWRGLPDESHFYFVHSYFPVPENPDIIAGQTDYSGTFASAIEAGAIQAVQFHPERSQDNGLALLAGFAKA